MRTLSRAGRRHQCRDEALAGHAAGAGRQRPAAPITAVTNPADRREIVGQWQAADAAQVERALANAHAAYDGWDHTPAAARAKILEHAADLMEERMPELIALCVKEAGKSLSASVAEVREAVDFCRYYAVQARKLFGASGKAARPDRRIERTAAAWPRRVRLHQPVEFPAGHLHRPDRRRAGRRQYA